MLLYGPFKRGGIHTSESNDLFDKSLKSPNKDWGVRDFEEINKVAMRKGFIQEKVFQMPVNNFSVIFRIN